jgi:lipid-A-disaccharide synthase
MLVAGESSGDIHGAALVEAARLKGADWRFFGLGGDHLAEAGVRLLGHIKDTAVMGLVEVLGSLGRLLAVRRRLKRAMELERPDLLVLIDAPDFNLPLARHAHSLGLPVVYYICPSVWAWRAGRLRTLAACARRRVVLFPFEKKFYEDRGVSADWVGHPVMDELPPPRPAGEAKAAFGLDPDRPLAALLPGSRRSVLARLAPVFFGAAERLLERAPELSLALPRAGTIEPEFLEHFLAKAPDRVRQRLLVTSGQSRELLAAADLSLVASGTASVEAMFLGTPQVVAYKGHPLTWALARRLVKTPFVSIANLVAGREIVPELLQDQATAEALADRAWPLLSDPGAAARARADLAEARSGLGLAGASARVADILAEELGR